MFVAFQGPGGDLFDRHSVYLFQSRWRTFVHSSIGLKVSCIEKCFFVPSFVIRGTWVSRQPLSSRLFPIVVPFTIRHIHCAEVLVFTRIPKTELNVRLALIADWNVAHVLLKTSM